MQVPVRMEVTVLADSIALNKECKSSYGLSMHVRLHYDDNSIRSFLFDTSESWATLRHNIKALNIKCDFRKVVISHWHRDHYGGLKGVVEYCNEVTRVYGPTRWLICKELEKLGVDFVECRGKIQVYKGVWIIGPISGSLEVALKVYIEGLGPVILTGCGHAGVTRILRWALNSKEKLYGIIGGLHIRRDYGETTLKVAKLLLERDLKMFVPLHHKFRKAIKFRAYLKDVLVDSGVGGKIIVKKE